MFWSNRIREEAAEKAAEFRLICENILWLVNDLRVNIRAAHRNIEAFFGRLLEKPDPARFAVDPPVWFNDEEVPPVDVPETDFFEVRDGGFPNVFDGKGLRYVPPASGTTIAQQRAYKAAEKQEIITPDEYGYMVKYRVSAKQTGLHNVTFAAQVKTYLKAGYGDKEIAIFTGKSESLVRQYRNCLEAAWGNAKEI